MKVAGRAKIPAGASSGSGSRYASSGERSNPNPKSPRTDVTHVTGRSQKSLSEHKKNRKKLVNKKKKGHPGNLPKRVSKRWGERLDKKIDSTTKRITKGGRNKGKFVPGTHDVSVVKPVKINKNT